MQESGRPPDIKIKHKKAFSVKCPALQRDVVLFKETWEDHIITAHPQMKEKMGLVQKAVQNCVSQADIYQKIKNSRKISVQLQCRDFMPRNQWLRVAIKIVDMHHAIVMSAYPVNSAPKEGIKRYEPCE